MFNKNTKIGLFLVKNYQKNIIQTDSIIKQLITNRLTNKSLFLNSQSKIIEQIEQQNNNSKSSQSQSFSLDQLILKQKQLTYLSANSSTSITSLKNVQQLNEIQVQHYFLTENGLCWEIKKNQMKQNFAIKKSKQFLNLNRIKQLQNKIVSDFLCNSYLANGNLSTYNEYPLLKLNQISLNFLENHQKFNHEQLYGKQDFNIHWSQLQFYLKKRMHNCSLKEYLNVLYIILQSFPFYRFNIKFIENILIGVRKQIPLMEQIQSAECFYLLSNRNRIDFDSFQLKRKFGLREITSQKTKKNHQLFQHDLLQSMQDKILDKIVSKYRKKYINTDLSLKQDDFIKICFWIQMIICYRNSSKITEQNKQSTKYLLQLLQVLLNKIGSNGVKNIKSKTLLEKKSFSFKSFNEIVEVLQILSNCQQYLTNQAQHSELSNKYDQYVYVNLKIQDTIKTILNYQNVKQEIKNTLIQKIQQQQSSTEKEQKQTKINIEDYAIKLKMMKILINYITVSDFIHEYKAINILQHTNQILINQNNLDNLKLIQLGEIQLEIFYEIWNNSNLIQFKQIQINFNKIYQDIHKAFFTSKQKKFNIFMKLKPQTIKKIIIIQLSSYFSLQNQQINLSLKQSHQKLNQIQTYLNSLQTLYSCFIAKDILFSFTQLLLGEENENEKKIFYIRELQWPLFNYFKLLYSNLKFYLQYKNSQEKNQQYYQLQNVTKKIRYFLEQIHSRNKKFYQFITQTSENQSNYLNLNKNLLISANHNMNQLALQASKSIQQKNYSKQEILFCQRILQNLQIQKKQYFKDQNLVKINKFFTQIKAFDLIRFGASVTQFNLSCQFLCTYKNNKNMFKNNHILAFYSTNELNLKSKSLQKILFEINNYNYDAINSEKFLKMHINQRVQFLKQILMKGIQNINSKQIQQKKIQQVIY